MILVSAMDSGIGKSNTVFSINVCRMSSLLKVFASFRAKETVISTVPCLYFKVGASLAFSSVFFFAAIIFLLSLYINISIIIVIHVPTEPPRHCGMDRSLCQVLTQVMALPQLCRCAECSVRNYSIVNDQLGLQCPIRELSFRESSSAISVSGSCTVLR